MKKKPVSKPEASRPAPAAGGSVSKTDVAKNVTPAKSATTGNLTRPPNEPRLATAGEAAQNILPPQSAPPSSAPVATQPTPPAKTEAPKRGVKAPGGVRRSPPGGKKSPALDIPPILLESDGPSVPGASGPGEKFSLGATPPVQSFSGGELPEAYGTKKLFLTARDPHWLYAHWDLTREQQNQFNGESADGHLILRIFAGKIEGHSAYEIHIHPDSRHWFAHVDRAGNSYAAELGYYSSLGKWMRISVSSGTVTPPDSAATTTATHEDATEFATIPFEFPLARLMQIIEDAVHDNTPLAQAIEELRRAGHSDLPRFAHSIHSPVIAPGQAQPWTPEQEKALARIINIDETRRVWMGSLEITELIRRRLTPNVTSPVTAFGLTGPTSPASPTSPFGGGPEKTKDFWFNVNAELIIYGATEPDAKVTLGGQKIQLRSDGTFSFRFALPDGKYDLPAVAISADGTDGRAAELKFCRETQFLGEVGATPQDSSLQPPLPENL